MHPHPAAFEVISPCTCWFPFPHPCSPEQRTNTSGGPLLPGLCRWWEPLPAAGMGVVFQQCFRTINVPSPGHRDVPSPEPRVPAEDSWGKAGQQDRAAPILDAPAAHFSLCKPPMGLQSCPREQPLPTSLPALAQEAAQLPLKLSPTLLRLLGKPRKDLIAAIFSPCPSLSQHPACPHQHRLSFPHHEPPTVLFLLFIQTNKQTNHSRPL